MNREAYRERVKVSVIMPAYNEERYIEECFNRVVNVLKDYGEPFEVILEEDGSTDETPRIIDKLASEHPFVKALHHPKRMGKGFGIKRCLEAAEGEYIVLIDSDMEYPPEKIPELLKGFDQYDIVIGFRSVWESKDEKEKKRTRTLLSRLYLKLIKALFDAELQDIQSGLKAFKREVIEYTKPLYSDGFEIDTEIVIKALKGGYKVGFIPITYTYKGESKVNIFTDPVKMLFSILKWRMRRRFNHNHREEPGGEP